MTNLASPDPSSLFGAPGVPSQWTQFDLLQLSQYFLGLGGGVVNGDLIVTTPPQSPMSVPTVSSVATGVIAPQPSQPGSVALSTGVDAITSIGYINVTWAADPAGLAQEWEVRFRKQGTTLYTYQRAAVNSSRCQNVIPNVIYEVGVQSIGRTGVQSGYGADSTVTTASAAQPPPEVSLIVDKLQTGTLSANVLLSGNIRTANSGQRVVMDSTGLRLYDSTGTVVVNLDAGAGSGTFTGTITGSTITGGLIRTAASGDRLEINSTAPFTTIKFFTGSMTPVVGAVTGGLVAMQSGDSGFGLGSMSSVQCSPAVSGTVAGLATVGGELYVQGTSNGTQSRAIYIAAGTTPTQTTKVTGSGALWVDSSNNLNYKNPAGTSGIIPAVLTSSSLIRAATTSVTFTAGNGTLTFPSAFPTACDGLVILINNTSASNTAWVYYNALSVLSATLVSQVNGAAFTGNLLLSYIAFGH